MKYRETQITPTEIKQVAKECSFKEPTQQQITHVVAHYNEMADSDPSGYWRLWVEQLLYDADCKQLSETSQNSNRARIIKSLFITYFDGNFEMKAPHNTFEMGVCKLEYKHKENELIVHLRRPALLIGKGGSIINTLTKQLGCKIGIVEVNLQK